MTFLNATITGVDEALLGFTQDTANKVFLPAVKEAGKVILLAYRNILIAKAKKPGNSGINAFAALRMKARKYKDDVGAWVVVGAAVEHGKMLAPQLGWGQTGTAERWTKARQYRGAMPAQPWFQQAVSESLPMAQQVLRTRINYLVSSFRSRGIS